MFAKIVVGLRRFRSSEMGIYHCTLSQDTELSNLRQMPDARQTGTVPETPGLRRGTGTTIDISTFTLWRLCFGPGRWRDCLARLAVRDRPTPILTRSPRPNRSSL